MKIPFGREELGALRVFFALSAAPRTRNDATGVSGETEVLAEAGQV